MIQPLDAGIIALFKIRYRALLMNHICAQDSGQFRINQVTLLLAVPWISTAFKDVSNTTISRCFHRTLGLEMFAQVANQTEFTEAFESLADSVRSFLSEDEVPDDLVLSFALNDEGQEETVESETAQAEVVAIEDPRRVLGWLERTIAYFENTCCHEEVSYAKLLIDKVLRHLNFE